MAVDVSNEQSAPVLIELRVNLILQLILFSASISDESPLHLHNLRRHQRSRRESVVSRGRHLSQEDRRLSSQSTSTSFGSSTILESAGVHVFLRPRDSRASLVSSVSAHTLASETMSYRSREEDKDLDNAQNQNQIEFTGKTSGDSLFDDITGYFTL